MAWEGSTRAERLPRDWARRRAVVLARAGYRCEHIRVDTGGRCEQLATDVDHIVRGDNHALENLQALCRWHHARKSSREGAQAANAKRARRAREPELHPFAARVAARRVGDAPG